VTKAAHLSYTKNAFAVEADTTKDVALTAGDANNDGIIDITDLGMVLESFEAEGDGIDCDFNADAIVDITDLGVILENFELENTVED
jgi:hypothetical protein